MRALTVFVCLAIFVCSLGPAAWAEGTPGSAAEEAYYGSRQAQSQGLEEFTGGSHGLVIAVVLIAAVAVIVYLLIEGGHIKVAKTEMATQTEKPAKGVTFLYTR